MIRRKHGHIQIKNVLQIKSQRKISPVNANCNFWHCCTHKHTLIVMMYSEAAVVLHVSISLTVAYKWSKKEAATHYNIYIRLLTSNHHHSVYTGRPCGENRHVIRSDWAVDGVRAKSRELHSIRGERNGSGLVKGQISDILVALMNLFRQLTMNSVWWITQWSLCETPKPQRGLLKGIVDTMFHKY